jgi:hypothetical protein
MSQSHEQIFFSVTVTVIHKNIYSIAVSHHADGIFGPFIVRQSLQRDPNSHLYDYDLDEHILTLSPWSHKISAYSLDFQRNIEVSSILINGEGSYFVSVFAHMFHLRFCTLVDSVYRIYLSAG